MHVQCRQIYKKSEVHYMEYKVIYSKRNNTGMYNGLADRLHLPWQVGRTDYTARSTKAQTQYGPHNLRCGRCSAQYLGYHDNPSAYIDIKRFLVIEKPLTLHKCSE